jgi:hypothetical protein
MNTNKSENFLLGISDYFFNDTKKDKRSSPPKWMKFKLHQKEWKEGYEYARTQEIDK